MPSNRCLSVCTVTVVYFCQTVGWIMLPLGTEVELGQGDIVLDGDPALPTERGTAALPTFRPMSTVAKWSRIPCSNTAELLFIYLFIR